MRFLDWVLPSRAGSRQAPERRLHTRKRTRLRPGKLLRDDRSFIADCAILDRSDAGVRIRVFDGGDAVEEAAIIFDDNDQSARSLAVAWHSAHEAGFATGAVVEPLSDEDRRRLAGPYYAVTD